MKKKVIIFGGGIGGLSAAHELTEGSRRQYFDVTIVESSGLMGGKARSERQAGTPPAPAMFPAEHGFRFFPTFYQHVIDTMSRTPAGFNTLGRTTVKDHLVSTHKRMLARDGTAPLVMPAAPNLFDLMSIIQFLQAIVGANTNISFFELQFFATRLLQIATSCEKRRLAQYQTQSWEQFVKANSFSPAYRRYLAEGLTRTLVAAKPSEINAKTGGDVLVRMLVDSGVPSQGAATDRVLDGPTTEVWIDPWVAELVRRGVAFEIGELRSLNVSAGRISKAVVRSGGADQNMTADHYVAALPVERMAAVLDLSPAVVAASNELSGIQNSLRHQVRFMTGLQFYLDQPLTAVDHDMGHAIFVDSNWALTGICQSHFWRAPFDDLSGVGGGNVATVWSTIISDWDKAYPVGGKAAKVCSRQELRDLAVEQLKDGLNGDGVVRFDDATVLAHCLDAGLTPGPEAGGAATHSQPLLVNFPSSWQQRPEAAPAGLANLVLAADYVRTTTDLATMEAANEAARRAVNAILQRENVPGDPCKLFELYYPEVLAEHSQYVQGLLMADELLFYAGIDWQI